MKTIYDMYRGRADSENRIKEIKYDFSVDKFAVHSFLANEACAFVEVIFEGDAAMPGLDFTAASP